MSLPVTSHNLREYQRGKYHCTIDLLFDWFGISCMTTDSDKHSSLLRYGIKYFRKMIILIKVQAAPTMTSGRKRALWKGFTQTASNCNDSFIVCWRLGCVLWGVITYVVTDPWVILDIMLLMDFSLLPVVQWSWEILLRLCENCWNIGMITYLLSSLLCFIFYS